MRSLIVDDEFTALSKMVTVLSEYGEADAATNGRQALEMFTKAAEEGCPYNLITVDIQMPEFNGFELLERIQKTEQYMKIPSSKKIMVSAQGSTDNVIEAGKHCCQAFLVKPVRRQVLTDKLRDLGLL